MTIEERYAHWREVIETQKNSGLSIAAYSDASRHSIPRDL